MKKIFTLNFDTKIFDPEKTISSYSTLPLSEGDEFKAPDSCIGNIMNFARSYRVQETRAIGKVEMIMN